MKVYLVWYICDLGKALWNIYSSKERADEVVQEIRRDFGYSAWYNEEEVQ